jgi:PiT family inorganic phosphate transporter
VNGVLVVAFGMALAFAVTNGLHDSADAIATLVATRAARPAVAVCLAAVGSIIGPLLLGKAVADVVGSIVTVPRADLVFVLGAGLTGAVGWNLVTWARGFPASSGHALLGGLVGAALAQGGVHRVHWGGFDGLRPDGVIGVIVVLAIAPVIGFAAGLIADRLARRAVRRTTVRVRGPVRALQWGMTVALAFSHGANDTQKTVGVVTVILIADREIHTTTAPWWVTLLCSVAFTAGTSLGGWPVVRTIGRRIVRLRPIDSLASQTASTVVLLAASIAGAPVSTTQVVGSSVVGVGAGHRRWRHVHWPVVRAMLLAWVVTVPAAAVMAVVALVPWRWFA